VWADKLRKKSDVGVTHLKEFDGTLERRGKKRAALPSLWEHASSSAQLETGKEKKRKKRDSEAWGGAKGVTVRRWYSQERRNERNLDKKTFGDYCELFAQKKKEALWDQHQCVYVGVWEKNMSHRVAVRSGAVMFRRAVERACSTKTKKG